MTGGEIGKGMLTGQRQLFKLFSVGVISAFLAFLLKVLGTNLSPALASTATTPTPQLNLVQAVILDIVQGLTEFLPISSTGHLKVVSVALAWGEPNIAFTAILTKLLNNI
jgi:undecaprenyl-diphosphatase